MRDERKSFSRIGMGSTVFCLPACHTVANVHRLEVCEQFYAEFSLLVSNAGFLLCFALRAEQTRFKVKLNQSCLHARRMQWPFLEINTKCVCDVCAVDTCNVHYDRFEQIMAQMHHIKQ